MGVIGMNIKFLLAKITVIFSLTIAFISIPLYGEKVNAFSNQIIQHGAIGDDVIELQSRLQYLGFYNGKIDGVFGWQTYWALRNFQYEFGLPIDGLAGTKTKNKLVSASKYNEKFVKEQINRGKKFTHYGGVDLNKQKTPSAKKGTTQTPTKKSTNKPGNNKQNVAKKPSNNGNKTSTNNKKTASNGNQAKTPATKKQTGTKNNTGSTTNKTNNTTTPNNKANNSATTNNKTNNTAATNGGEKTTGKKATAANVPNGFSQNDIQLIANAVYGESRGEPYIGQVAVASVILNRIDSVSFPNTVSGVIFEPGAFTAVADGQIWLTPNERAKEAVLDAINGWDPTGNAIYYFNPDTATSAWIWSRPQIKQIGKHIFCK